MPQYHKFSLEELSKRSGERRKMALEALLDEPRTANELASLWNVHPNSAYKVILRLYQKGLIKETGDAKVRYDVPYKTTQRGIEKLRWLSTENLRGTAKAPSSLDGTYPHLDELDSLLDSPISLMRPVEVDYDKFIAEGVHSLPSRLTLKPEDLHVEQKYDGWLVQTIAGRMYTRAGKELTEKFPAIAKAMRAFRTSFVLGELVYTFDGQSDESKVTTVAGTKDPQEAIAKAAALPGEFSLVLFDLLHTDGQDIDKWPFADRRQALVDEVGPTSPDDGVQLMKAYSFAEWSKAFKNALQRGDEGVVIKSNQAPFFWEPLGGREPQRVGTQWKVKALRMDSFVVYDYYYSEKNRLIAKFGQFWRGELIPVGEFNNLSRENELELEKRLKRGPVLVELVYQKRFDGFPGKLREPRFRRFRDDVELTPANAALPREFAPYS